MSQDYKQLILRLLITLFQQLDKSVTPNNLLQTISLSACDLQTASFQSYNFCTNFSPTEDCHRGVAARCKLQVHYDSFCCSELISSEDLRNEIPEVTNTSPINNESSTAPTSYFGLIVRRFIRTCMNFSLAIK